MLTINVVQAESIFSNSNGQESEEEGVSFFGGNRSENNGGTNPGVSGTENDDYNTNAPIDDYVPLLVLGAVALGFYTRKKLM